MNDLIHCKSLAIAEVIVQPTDLEAPVTGINILEATDIERWAKPGMVILSSYFALQSHSQVEMQEFFDKLKQFAVACLIIKVDRLVKEIPDQFKDFCKSYEIPLIRIGGETKYEDIIVEVLTFILGNREQRLALYYRVSKISSEMTLEMLSIHEILERFKTFLRFDLTLLRKDRRSTITTNKNYQNLVMGEELEFFHSEYMTFGYKYYQYLPGHSSPNQPSSVVLVEFSSSEDSCETLAIHETQKHKVDENDIVVIENLIRCLQLNLLREFSGKQKMLLNKNTLVNDLLRGMITDPAEFEAVCANLNIHPNGFCQVLTLTFSTNNKDDQISLYDVKNQLRLELKRFRDQMVYYVTPRYDQYILSNPKDQQVSFDSNKIKNILDRKIAGEKFAGMIHYFGGVSDFFPVKEIASAGSQSMAVADFLSQNNANDTVREYRNLGLFKLFLGKDAARINEIVPEELVRIQMESPELFSTLAAYLKNNRNFTSTADQLFLHPKTVKYRINKIVNDYHLDLNNMYFVTLIQAAIEVMEFQGALGFE
jgi:purine catabolism regulator